MTPLELRFAALKETGIVGVLETPSAEQDQLAVARYQGLHAQLLKDNVADWAVDEDIPTGAEQPMIWMLAYLIANVLGASPEDVQRLAGLGMYKAPSTSIAERMLRSYMSSRYVSQPATAEYL